MSEALQHDVRLFLWLIPALPLAAAVLITFLGPSLLKGRSHWPCIAALALAFGCAFRIFFDLLQAMKVGNDLEQLYHPVVVVTYYQWFLAGDPGGGAPFMNVGLSLRADALSIMMATMITFVGTLIAIFSRGYMAGEGGYPRFFAAVSLFVTSMTTLVLSDNFILLFFGWEGVGLCSYLLIGFWFAKPSAAAAARKAFLVTRIGDVGMMIGVMLLWVSTNYHFDYGGYNVATGKYEGVFGFFEQQARHGQVNEALVTTICLLLFCGAVGKSAQFPLHVWLPDAMEGPTPVSALIHAATMVTAGVYLVARCTPLFILAPTAQMIVGLAGGITALLAALIALTQTDLKRVMAYSTLSQLGYMFLGLGSGVDTRAAGTHSHHLATLTSFAVIAALFHLFTHAFFKALLFLSSGSVMHAMGGIIDMRRFSGLRKVMPITHWTFLCGAGALAGIPLLSGFWSKDEIIGASLLAAEHPGRYSGVYYALFITAIVTAALTAFYTFRAYFLTFWGELRVPEEAYSHAHGGHGGKDEQAHGSHGHAPPMPAPPVTTGHGGPSDHGHGAAHDPATHRFESPPVMTVPLIILAIFAVGVGAALGPTHLFAHFLERTPGMPEPMEEANYLLMGISGLIALAGVAVAYLMYVQQPALPGKLAHSARNLYRLSLDKFYFDEIYYALVVHPLAVLAALFRTLDYFLVDGLVDLVGNVPRLLGYPLRPVQNGLVQFYALAMVLSLTVLLLSLVYYL